MAAICVALWILGCLLLPAGHIRAQSPGAVPVKLVVKPARPSFQVGEPLELEIALLDANNKAAPSPKSLTVEIVRRDGAGTAQKLSELAIPTGQSTGKVRLTAQKTPGLFYFWARNKELLPGGTFLKLSPERQPIGRRPLKNAEVPELQLRFSPQRDFLADGKDEVTIHALLSGAALAPPSGIRIQFFDSSGTLRPRPLVVSAKEDSAVAVLTSREVGDVRVEFLGSIPPVALRGEKELKIRFGPPITQLALHASPPDPSLSDTPELIVQLLNDSNKPTPTDKPRQITLSLESGSGQLERFELTIANGSFEARTHLHLARLGTMKVAASSPNLLTTSATLRVGLPLTLILALGLGGLVAGVVYCSIRSNGRLWSLAISIIGGVIIYLFAALLVTAPAVRVFLVKPIGAFALSMIGGLAASILIGLAHRGSAADSGTDQRVTADAASLAAPGSPVQNDDGPRPDPGPAVDVFYSYSHHDEGLCRELQNHLSLLKRSGWIRDWYDRRIGAGTEWAGQIDDHLKSADVILLLISSDFMASDYCYDVEMNQALQRHQAGAATVIPVILRPVDWSGAPFAKLQALPKDARPITAWPNRDEAFADVARGIRAAVQRSRIPTR